MPEKKTIRKSRELKREGKAPTTQAGPFVQEEMEHIREGKHGAQSTEQAIAIGLSKARRAGVKLPVPAKGTTSDATRKRAATDLEAGERAAGNKTTRARSVTKRSTTGAKGRSTAKTRSRTRSTTKRSTAVAKGRETTRTRSRTRTAAKAARVSARQRGD